MNFITNLSSSRRRDYVYDAILIIVDRYIKMMRYLSITKKINVFDLEQLLMKEIFLRFDSLEDIVTNRDSVFMSAFWSQVCYQIKIKRRLSTVFYSQTNNQIERQNQILKHYLRVFCNEQQNDWANLLFIVEYVYQQSQYKTLNYSLFYIMYDYNLDFELRIENNSS